MNGYLTVYGRRVRFAISIPRFVEDGPFDTRAFRSFLKRKAAADGCCPCVWKTEGFAY